MKTLWINLLRPILPLLTLLLCCACEPQETLCFNHDEHDRPLIDIVFDWSKHPDADPVSMRLYLFEENTNNFFMYEFDGRDGGERKVPPGRYTAIAINYGYEQMKVRNHESLATFDVWLRDAYELQGLSVRSFDLPRAPGAEGERMASAAEPLWYARRDGIVIAPSTRSDAQLVMTPEDILTHINVDISSVDNLKGVSSLSATISGMSASINMSDLTQGPEQVTISFELVPSGPDSLTGTVHTLGHCGPSRAPEDDWLHHITVYAVLKDGSQWYNTYDVTDQLHSVSTNNYSLTLDGLPLPQPGVAGGGFNIDVSGWAVVEEYIPM